MVVVDLLDLEVVSWEALVLTWAIHLQWQQAILMLWEIKADQWDFREGWLIP